MPTISNSKMSVRCPTAMMHNVRQWPGKWLARRFGCAMPSRPPQFLIRWNRHNGLYVTPNVLKVICLTMLSISRLAHSILAGGDIGHKMLHTRHSSWRCRTWSCVPIVLQDVRPRASVAASSWELWWLGFACSTESIEPPRVPRCPSSCSCGCILLGALVAWIRV